MLHERHREPSVAALRVLLGAVFLSGLVSWGAWGGLGCSKPYVLAYQQAVAENRQRTSTLRLGTTREEVDAVMGVGELVNYKRIKLSNPWRTEAFHIEGGIPVEIRYYVTDGLQWKNRNETETLTPIVFESDKLVGWGWPFLNQNMDRYRTGEHSIP